MITRTMTYLGRRVVQTEVKLSGGARSILTYWVDGADQRNGGYAPGSTVWAVYSGDYRKGHAQGPSGAARGSRTRWVTDVTQGASSGILTDGPGHDLIEG